MGQRQALLLATFLTTFGLVLIGAVAFRLTNTPDVAVESVSESTTVPLTESLTTTTPTTTSATILTADDQAISDLMASREAAYEAALRQANEQLQAAYDQLGQVSGAAVTAAPPVPAPAQNAAAPDTSAPSAPAPAPAAPTFAVSADGAAQIGLAAAPAATLNATPELVDFQGAIAYEVATSAGLVYVDANSGAVLFNGAAPAPAPAVNNAPAAAPAAPAPLPPAPAAPTNQISGDQAIAIAIGAVGPGEIDKAKLEEEHGILIWDIKFTNDNEVRIDAYTGAIVRTRIENDND